MVGGLFAFKRIQATMKSRTPRKEEQVWLDKSFQVPCLACSIFHEAEDTPAEYHHMKGHTHDNVHLLGFSLCDKHHRISDTLHPKRWISRHGDGKVLFEERYMKEGAFLERQKEMVAQVETSTI